MGNYTFTIKGDLKAMNWEYADKKSKEAKEKLAKLGFEACEVHLKGDDKPSDK